ncbi:AAA family ATPase [Cytobacillus purgationiresistens]|uniref:Kinase n=1 Tax=Cytobacillus purgationiresistens TaxID=863449 RepID=A0ABU0AA97_9BACI|nr:AAA family ATPase [Cytobacillus purgationiresistens]MDQ0268165.1 putative kinase [Cytobacillus purgationiresistens]
MTTFIQLVGLPGSGKSTLAMDLCIEYNAIHLSSDDIRSEQFGDEQSQAHNQAVFSEMEKRTKAALSSGINVVFDATNLNRKRRRHFINHIVKSNHKIVYYMNTSIEEIRKRNQTRSRKVDDQVIDKMYTALHIPILGEGWDRIIYVGPDSRIQKKDRDIIEDKLRIDLGHDQLFDSLSTEMIEFKNILNLPHDSTYHSFSVSRHTYYVYQYILNHYHKDDKPEMIWAALFHDTGKSFCKSFTSFKGEETKYAHYYGHEFVSSQIASSRLNSLGYNEELIRNVSTLVQFHMIPMNATEKKLAETKELLGDHLFRKLLFLHEADMQAK